MNHFALHRLHPTLTLTRTLRTSTKTLTLTRTLTSTPRALAWTGSGGEEHTTNRKDELDVQSGASKSGKRDRVEGNKQSSAASETDSRDNNKRAKEDHPEAPGPVIGMNDERGGVSFYFFSILSGSVIGRGEC